MPSSPHAPPPSPGTRARDPFLALALARPARPEVRERALRRLEEWAAAVAARLSELGCEARPALSPRAEGAIRVVLAQASSRGDRPGASAILSIAEEQVEVAVELAPAGVPPVRARLADPVRALELTTALQALPEQFTIGLEGGPRSPAVACASTDDLRALLDQVEQDGRKLWLGWSIPRDVAVLHAALLEEQLEDAVVALSSVLLLAPVADGPFGGRASHATVRRERGERPRGDGDRRLAKRRARERPARDAEGELDPDPDRQDPAAPHPVPERASAPRAAARPTARKRPAGRSAPRGQIDKGARVRVLEGPFSGKVGVVQELDGKGGARVMLGLLAVRVDVRDLSRCDDRRDRPVLSSSHRKPLPVRS